jgi:hypothetical protein
LRPKVARELLLKAGSRPAVRQRSGARPERDVPPWTNPNARSVLLGKMTSPSTNMFILVLFDDNGTEVDFRDIPTATEAAVDLLTSQGCRFSGQTGIPTWTDLTAVNTVAEFPRKFVGA